MSTPPRTKQGYEIAVVGESANTARYAGINVSRVMRRTMFLSGALCGLVGMLQFAGADYTITEGTAGGVASPPSPSPAGQDEPLWDAGGLGVHRHAGARRQHHPDQLQDPGSASDLLIGIILFFMLGCEFFLTYKLIPRGKEEHHA